MKRTGQKYFKICISLPGSRPSTWGDGDGGNKLKNLDQWEAFIISPGLNTGKKIIPLIPFYILQD